MIEVCRDPADAAQFSAGLVSDAARRAMAERGAFRLAISGGSTPRLLHAFLARPPLASTMPWSDTHLFWVDERCVPYTESASNYGAARVDLLDHVPLKRAQVHAMPVRLPPEKGALQYEATLRAALPLSDEGLPILDLVTHRFSYTEASEAYALFASRVTGKVLLDWTG